MIEIARKSGSSVPVKRSDISDIHNISKFYLESVLAFLRDKRLIRSVRGAHGGFLLGKPAEKITLYEIFTALEGPIVSVECVENPRGCNQFADCRARMVWKKLHEAQVGALKGITLQDLCEDDGDEGSNYVI